MKKYFFLFFIVQISFSQIDPTDPTESIASPNVMNLGRFGEIPVSHFTGVPEINLGLTEVKCGDIKIPIEVLYDGSGCKVYSQPSWVGLNMSLNVGGAIRRQSGNDEYVYRGLQSPKSYFDYNEELQGDDWITKELSNNSIIPGEYSFNFLGFSGTFLLNHENEWVVKGSYNRSMRIIPNIEEDYLLEDINGSHLQLVKTITGFTIITEDGTKYIFGGDKDAIEFSRPPLPIMVAPYNSTGPPGPESMITYNTEEEITQGITSTAWHLKKIISSSNRVVNFEYEKYYSINQVVNTRISRYRAYAPRPYLHSYNRNVKGQSLINSSILKKIVLDNGVECIFNSSKANDLEIEGTFGGNTQLTFELYKSSSNLDNYNNIWEHKKLTSLEVRYNNKTKMKFGFSYIENPSERLKLREIKFYGKNTFENAEGLYLFEYNNLKLPDYDSGEVDHWGYYNGTNFWNNEIFQGVMDIPNLDQYYDSRQTNPVLMQAEMLQKIIYPTGGYTEFFFEANDFSKEVKYTYPISIKNLNINEIAGGLRVSKILSHSSDGELIEKKYYYKNNSMNGGGTSSGVLMGRPSYYEEYDGGDEFIFSSNSISRSNTTNGNHITYSEVKEEITGNGYTVYTYSNSDNGYLDKDPLFISDPLSGIIKRKKSYAFGKLNIERGLLLNTKYFDKNNYLIKQMSYFYNDDEDKYNEYARVRKKLYLGLDPSNSVEIAYPIYTFYPYLKKKVVYEYFDDKTIINEMNYNYNLFNQLKSKEIIYNTGTTYLTEYKYVHEMISEDPIYLHFMEKNMVGIPTTISDYVDEKLRKEEVFTYSLFNGNILKPKFKILTSKNNRISSAKLNYSGYDSFGNIRGILKNDELYNAYLWGYNGQHLIAKCIVSKESPEIDISVNYDAYEKESYGTGGTAAPGSVLKSFTHEKSGTVSVAIETLNIDNYSNDASLSVAVDIIQGNNVVETLDFNFNRGCKLNSV
ncbi:hypothetical protein SAMN02927921_04185 [Sinomicrobium oceani]|uniref:YD repeat-containing protein n=1 Tax=Sinomicrobium oceani TaxID=1150368 RepID=A0A1K1RYY4_9FLAO|nr:hypothetical protein [Sinomicrobium oceani]SFW77007.1 hypothetical protein SAMN02927921_04185 [Sinomicrobium oceani]